MQHPRPVEDAVNRDMLNAWRSNGHLLLQHCSDCGEAFYYPRKRCPSCWSAKIENRASTGRGTIVTFSLIHRGVDEIFRAQGVIVALAVVKTDEGPEIITRIVTDDLSKVKIGLGVTLYAGTEREIYPLPVYELTCQQA
jgi:uncharacterized OB-fold protein